ncbi:MAG: ATP-dependent DNA ligase [Thermoplasmata archaeon]|nr:ATP-dependent DNA ligase [Thermoplasmata archaeon]
MQFAELVATYDKLAATTKRLEMRQILAELFQRLPPDEIAEAVYLSQGLLRPEFEGIELGVAGQLARRALADALGIPEEKVAQHVRQSGDLGTTAAELAAGGPSGGEGAGRTSTVREVYAALLAIATASGDGSQKKKIELLAEVLRGAGPSEAKYLTRLVLGQLRLGVGTQTILDSLADAFAPGDKAARLPIENAYNVSSDLGLVATSLAKDGLPGLQGIHLQVGRPIRPMLAERSPDLVDVLKRMDGGAALEYKYDGLRIQAHIPATGPAKLFSRRLEEMSAQFPELIEELPKVITTRPAIVEGECVSVSPETGELQPFQEISRRRGRKYDLERMQAEVPVRLFLFDVLLAGDEESAELDFPARRHRLEKILAPTDRVQLATQRVVASVEEATAFFDESIADGCEGVMAKSLAAGSRYRAGARGFWWIKYKREYTISLADSIDGVVVGAFHGRGRRAGAFGAFLLATYNRQSDLYETFCKAGSGFDDAQLAEMPKRLERFRSPESPKNVSSSIVPDQWFRPGLVLEVRGAELSLSAIHRAAFGAVRPGAGFALRFPRFTGNFREDKGPEEATTADELVKLYTSQVRHHAVEGPGDAG